MYYRGPDMPYRGDDTEELDDREWPDPDGGDEPDAEVDTVPCPFCRAPVYNDAERCPHCGNYIFYEGQPASSKPWWLVGGVAVCLAIVGYWILYG